MNEKWFAMSIEDIEKKLKTNAAMGLAPKAARSRWQKDRKPFFAVKKRRADKLLIDLLSDFFLILLMLVAFFSLFFEGDYLIGSAMLILVGVNLGLSYFFYYRDKRSIESMSSFFTPTARVIRGGKLYIADYKDVVEGDVILVEKGDVLGCDARLVYSEGLSVNMKLDKKTDKLLQKYASGAVGAGELHAENMSNMLHAGSVVRSGSGRAIVVATGEFTYLGAMTGGITEVPSEELPEGLAVLKKKLRKLGMLLLLLTLPFCMFSLMFGSFTGGTVVLSEALSVILTVGATAMLTRASNTFIGFYARYMRKAALSEDPCIVRSAAAFDKLANTDYLFVLDGSIASDGILHFEGLYTTDGETTELGVMGQSAAMLSDMIGIYTLAGKGALSVAGVSSQSAFDGGINEFMSKSSVDLEALKIRCPIQSFLPGVDRAPKDIIVFNEGGERKELCVSLGADSILECDSALFSGVKKTLTEEGKEIIKRSCVKYFANGRRLMIFTLKEEGTTCFLGALVLHEGVDLKLAGAISALRKSGVRIVAFSNCTDRTGLPEIPDILRRGNRAYATELIKQGKHITHDFGSYDEYCGLDESMIAELARYVKAQGKTLSVIGFSSYAKDVIGQSDVFISCAPVRTAAGDTIGGEIHSLEVPGEHSSASCTQEVKAEADVLLMRPMGGKGGIEPLAKAMSYCTLAYRNLKNYLVYLVTVQLMRILTIAFPMLFGYSTADARQMLFFGFVLDFFVMMVFMGDMRRPIESREKIKKDVTERNIIDILKSNKLLSVCALVGSGVVLVLPRIFDIIGVFGAYLYRAEFTYISLLLMQIMTLLAVYSRDVRNKKAHMRLINNRWVQIGGGICLLFTLLCFITPVGRLFGVIKSPILYFLLSLVPPIAFGTCFVVVSTVKEKESKARRTRKM